VSPVAIFTDSASDMDPAVAAAEGISIVPLLVTFGSQSFKAGVDLSTVRFPPTDIAAIARGFGFDAVSVTRPADLAAVQTWLDGARERPLLIDAKVTADRASWWLEEAFRGH